MNVKQRMVAVHTPVSNMKEDTTVVVMLDMCSQPMKLTVLVRAYIHVTFGCESVEVE